MAEIISDDDEDLKRAIALSLQDTQVGGNAKPSNATGQSTDSSETEDEVEPTETSGQPNMPHLTTLTKEITPPAASQSQSSTSSVLKLDRKQMEQERLDRLAKRKRATSDEDDDASAKRARLLQESTNSNSITNDANGASDGASRTEQVQTIQYPQGRIMKTFARHHARQGDITIEEVLQKDHLNTAIISAFTCNAGWLFGKLNTKRTKLILCLGAKGEIERQQWSREAEEIGRGSIKIIWPPMEGGASLMHSKLMLLRYDHSLRIVITSANVEQYDWGETGVMENTVFLIDLPELHHDKTQTTDDLSPFGQDLLYFLKASNFDDKILNGLLRFDFTSTNDIGFAHSIGGTHFGANMQKTGFPSISRCVHQLGLVPPEGSILHLSYISASLGALSAQLLKSMVDVASGRAGTSVPTPESSIRDKLLGKPPTTSHNIQSDFTVLFPTIETVEHSTGGPDNAGTICLNEASYLKTTFPRRVLRDYVSNRRGMLSHAKIMLAYTTGAQDPKDNKAWVYVGSHNFTESAWGKVSKDRARQQTKMLCRNWECGVIVPVRMASIEIADTTEVRERFASVIDVPCKVPGATYKDDDEPWLFMKKSRWN